LSICYILLAHNFLRSSDIYSQIWCTWNRGKIMAVSS